MDLNIIKKLSSIKIVAATKTRTVQEIQEAINAGIKIIGENYVQEAEEKYEAIKGKAKFHLIGHLQKNKVKKAVVIFDCIQTVDSIKIADEINKECAKLNKVMDVMIEVNIANEQNKSGCLVENVNELAEHIKKLQNLKLIGLMTMGPAVSPEQLRPHFRKMKQIFDTLNLKELSMGMSDSYKVAIEEGASMVRLGTVLFGKRN